MRLRRLRRVLEVDAYAIGRRQASLLDYDHDAESLRILVRLGEQRVANAQPHELPAALGILAGYREALERAEAS